MKKYILKKTTEMTGGSLNNNKSLKKILYFFSDDCHYCDEFQNDWNRLKDYYHGSIECTKYYGRDHPDLKVKYKVDGYPTIIFENDDQSFFEYQYKRKFNKIKKFIDSLDN